jgi:hypothetical protein
MPTVLIVSASPLDQDRLRLGAEVRDIRNALQRSRNRDHWKIESNEAATVDDLRRALLDLRPAMLHFAGHGNGPEGLLFEDANGNTHCANAGPLARLFHHFKDNLKCVVLNACYSEVQAMVIREEIDYIVGMRTAIDDDAARRFAVAFYDGVFAGSDFRTAFDLACTALDLNSIPDANAPILITSPHLDATSISYTSKVPEAERVLYAYLNTPYRDRWAFTTTGEALIPLLVKHYGEHMHGAIDKVQVLGMNRIGDEHWKVQVSVFAKEEKSMRLYYFRIRDRALLIEWEASVGLWSIPLNTYLAMPRGTSVVARVVATLDNYYNCDFRDAKMIYQSIELTTIQNSILHGYVARGTPVYDKIMDILRDGNEHFVTLGIRNVTNESDMPLITDLLSPTWIYHPIEAASNQARDGGT